MNSDAQRARNKRKRAKLREKRRMDKDHSLLRFSLNGRYEDVPLQPCGLVGTLLCVRTESKWGEFSSDWVYSSTHDLSSSAIDAIECFCNTWNQVLSESPWVTVELVVQFHGLTRRKVWRGHTKVGAIRVAEMVCSFASQMSSEE